MQPRPRKLSAFTLSTAMAFGAAAVLAIGLPTPVAAQQTSGQDAWQAGESVVQAHNKASQAKDAAGVAALYTRDAIMVTPDGPLVGQAAIEKYYAESFKVVTLGSAKLDQVVMAGDAVRLRTGTWAGVFQSPNGPIPVKGYWTTTDVLDGNTWKIRLEAGFPMTPPPSEPKK
jgi:uncharacterized protein (TIGR02246 family)